MFVKIDPKRKVRYPGTELNDWKVITHSGVELGRFEPRKINAKQTVSVWIVRWPGFKQANAAAKALGAVAVRA